MAAVRRRKRAAKRETRRRKKEKNQNTRRNTKRGIGSRDRSLIGEIGSEWLHQDLIINQRDETPPAITAATRRGTDTATISTAREEVTLERTTATAREVTGDIKRETDRREAGEEEEEAVRVITSGGVAATGTAGTTTGGTGGREESEEVEVEDIIITATKVTTDEIMQIPTPSPATTRKTRDPTTTRRRNPRPGI